LIEVFFLVFGLLKGKFEIDGLIINGMLNIMICLVLLNSGHSSAIVLRIIDTKVLLRSGI